MLSSFKFKGPGRQRSALSFADVSRRRALKQESNTCPDNSSSVYISNREPSKGGSCLLLVDPQVDFVSGSLSVPGADEDCKNIAKFIRDNFDNLKEIYVTLDTHMQYHIAHPMFWKEKLDDGEWKHPEIFTQIPNEEVGTKFVPVDPKMATWVKDYTADLEKQERLPGLSAFKLTIWPPHCLIGTEGHNVDGRIATALKEWEVHNDTAVHYIMKGNNSKTEHYSAFRAEIIVPEDPSTEFNEILYKDLISHPTVFVAGEAKSHCVNFTVRDLIDRMEKDHKSNKVVLLDGGMNNVVGCESQGASFWTDMHDHKNVKFSDISKGKTLKALGTGLIVKE